MAKKKVLIAPQKGKPVRLEVEDTADLLRQIQQNTGIAYDANANSIVESTSNATVDEQFNIHDSESDTIIFNIMAKRTSGGK